MVELGLFGDRPSQLGLHGSTLAAREVAAAQLGPQLLDVVVEGVPRGNQGENGTSIRMRKRRWVCDAGRA